MQNEMKVAIVGMSCRFPAADDLDQFWHLLQSQASAISEIPDSRWPSAAHFAAELQKNKSISRWAGLVQHGERLQQPLYGTVLELLVLVVEVLGM